MEYIIMAKGRHTGCVQYVGSNPSFEVEWNPLAAKTWKTWAGARKAADKKAWAGYDFRVVELNPVSRVELVRDYAAFEGKEALKIIKNCREFGAHRDLREFLVLRHATQAAHLAHLVIDGKL